MDSPSSSSPWQALADRARALIEAAQPAQAEALLRAELPTEAMPAQRDALYCLAVAQRLQKCWKPALETLTTLVAIAPDHGRAHQERGHVLRSTGRHDAALEAYEQAVAVNPALAASWRALLDGYRARSGPESARQSERAKAQLAFLDSLPPVLRAAHGHFGDGRYLKADALCRAFLRENKHHVEGMRLLARIGEALGVLLDAEFLFETALELAPSHTALRFEYANLLLKMQKFEAAVAQTRLLVAAQPDDLAVRTLHANALAGHGAAREAVALYDQVLDQAPEQPAVAVMRGHALKALGDLDGAVAAYRQAIGVRPGHGDAWWSLANTKTYRFDDSAIVAMEQREAAPDCGQNDRVHLCFALAKAREDRAQPDAAFSAYERGNRLQRRRSAYAQSQVTERVDALMATCTAEFFAAREAAGCAAPDPIFIVGLPRAGSTLLEQILASHSQIDGTMELPQLIALSQRLRHDSEAGYPGILPQLAPDYFRRFAEQYLADTQSYRAGAPRFVDKHPNNFFHVGLIRLLFPKAKVIDARRHPLSCGWSVYKQLFGQGQEFSYDLADIGAYYRDYVRLMDHWDTVLPGFVLRVQHEAVVDDLEGQVRRLLAFCDVPFEPACLTFFETARSVRTPSSEQVRQPIYRSGLDAWKPYEPWLDPLKRALGPEVRAAFAIEEPLHA